MSLLLRLSAAALAVAVPSVAHGAWHKASSKHFIIYSDDKPERLKAYAEKLERFDQAARRVLKRPDPNVGDGNRVTIYVLDSIKAVQKLHGRNDTSLYGFYQGGFSGSVAFTPRRADEGERGGLKAESVFFHEYNHHLMFQSFERPYPNWYVEGFAELLGTPRFEKDGSVTLGIAPLHRGYGLLSGGGLSATELLQADPWKLSKTQRESLYGRGWLLSHYLAFEPARAGQLSRYLGNLEAGQDNIRAATGAFGDLQQLDRELEKYLVRRKLGALTVSGSTLAIGPISITPLSTGASEAMEWKMISKRGVERHNAKQVADSLRAIGVRHPTDPFVQVALAEAEFDVDNFKGSLAAAEAALKAEPRSVEALVYKGRALASLAEKEDPAASFAKAREAYLAANKIDTEDPEPLFLYFESFLRDGRRPTPNAIKALHYASVLAPQDQGLRVTSAMAWLNEGKLAQARVDLLPIAYDPHGGDHAERARRAVESIDSKDSRGALAALSGRRQAGEVAAAPVRR